MSTVDTDSSAATASASGTSDSAAPSASPASSSRSLSAPQAPSQPRQQPEVAERSVSSITFRLPQYWPGDPQLWFAQAEAHFANHRITNPRVKYNVVVSSLAPEYATEIRDLLIAPADEPYKVLKEALTARTQKSDQARLRELLSTADVGDRKPTRVLRRMQQLLGTKNLDATILRELFVQRLPSTVQLILAATPASLSLDELASLADKVVESTAGSASAVHAIAPVDTHTSSRASTYNQGGAERTSSVDRAELTQLRHEVEKLSTVVYSLTSDDTGAPRGRPRQRSATPTSRSRSRGSESRTRDPDGEVCWYHRTYGDKAKKCRQPCSHMSQSGNGKAGH